MRQKYLRLNAYDIVYKINNYNTVFDGALRYSFYH